MATTTEKSIQAAAGLGNADPSAVLYGVFFTSESGFNQSGTFIPSAANTVYDNTESKLDANNVQGAIDDLASKAGTNATNTEQNTADITNHTGNKNNPHGVTKAQLGLGNVDNTADSAKSVKYATNAGSATKATQDGNGNVIADTYATAANLTSHTGNKSNPHGVTKAQVGLSNVPNVATNDQTPTYTAATTATALVSGEKLSTALGKIAKAVSDLISHLANKNNPHGVTKAQLGLGNVDNTADSAKSVKYATSAGSATSATSATKATQDASGNVITDTYATAANLTSHTGNKSNPHGVTKSQVGLSNVPNVTTNNQTPTYTAASTAAALVSGETLSTAFGKIAKAVSDLISHLANKSNPHGVTKSQVGLGNVPNVSTNDQTPTYTVASGSSLAELVSGEKLSTAFGKIAQAVDRLSDHLESTYNPHGVTKSQVGLSNVPNVTTNNQTPTYTEASSLAELKSGETLSTAMGKIARAVYTVYHEHKYEVTGTLDADDTQLILEHSQLAERSTIDIYTDLFGANIESVTVTDGRIVIVFEPQETVMEVKVRWDNGLV